MTDPMDSLMDRYLDGDLGDEERERLYAWLEDHPEAVGLLADRSVLHVELRKLLTRRALQRGASEAVESPGSSLKPTRRPTRRRLVGSGTIGVSPYVWTALAAGVLVVLTLLLSRPPEPAPSPDRIVGKESPEPPEAEDRAFGEQARKDAEERVSRLREEERRADEARRAAKEGELKKLAEREFADISGRRKEEEERLRKLREAPEEAKRTVAQTPEAVPAPEKPPAKPRETPTEVVLAQLTNVRGDVLVLRKAARVPAAEGSSMGAGDEIETGGDGASATIVYPDQTRLELKSKSNLRILAEDSGKRAELATGGLAAEVFKQPADRPLVIVTPHAEAKVLGTTLRLRVEPGEKGFTRLEVEEGRVRFTRLADGSSVDVVAGHFAVAMTGLTLTTKPLPVDEVLLLSRQARLFGTDWRFLKDEKASSGIALEAPLARTTSDTQAAFKKGVVGYAEFTFTADAGREYWIWIRGQCTAAQNRTAHDIVLLMAPGGRFTRSYFQIGPTGDREHSFNGYGQKDGYWWVGGNADRGPNGVEGDAVPVSLLFGKSGVQKVRLYPCETPMRIDAIWLTTTQKTRPDAQRFGPDDPRK